MPQGSLGLAKPVSRGGRRVQQKASKMRKGSMLHELMKKPKKQSLAAAHNKHKKMTAAIARNIERSTGKALVQSGGDLSILKRVAGAAKGQGDEASKRAKVPKFDTRKQFRLTS